MLSVAHHHQHVADVGTKLVLLGPTGAQHNRRDGNQLGCAHGRQLGGALEALPVHGPTTLSPTALAKLRDQCRGTLLHTRWSTRRPEAVTMHAITQTVLHALQDGDTTLDGVFVSCGQGGSHAAVEAAAESIFSGEMSEAVAKLVRL